MTAAARLDHFAELLSQDLPTNVIAERMAISQPYARTLLQRLIKRMGKEQCQ
jgi:DNA-binding CsgD family transcriptional regulator